MRRKPEFEGDELNIWAAFTDLMSNALLILSLILVIPLLINITKTKDIIKAKDTTQEAEKYKEKSIDLENKNKNLEQKINNLEKSINQFNTSSNIPKSNTPPIIFLSDSGAIRFKSGSAGLQGQQMLQEFDKAGGLIEAIESNAKLYGINLVEIIGHTDLQPIGSLASNLDKNLLNIANNIDIDRATTDSLVAGSNADLGLMRAVEIMRILRYYQGNNKRLQGLEFRAYSAAQLVPPKLPNNEKPKDDDKRRIEIRFTRLDENNTIRR